MIQAYRNAQKGARDAERFRYPMLQMVPMPVEDKAATPGPWYSTIAPVPPFTVKMPATFKMMSAATVSEPLLN